MVAIVTSKYGLLILVALVLNCSAAAIAEEHEQRGPCNGYKELCDRPYNNVTFLISHDSYAFGQSLAATQSKDIIQQLNDGIRALKLSPVHVEHDDSVHLCHTACAILDAGPATTTLDHISSWLQDHPREVVTIFWNNLYNIESSRLRQAYEKSAIMPFVYQHQNKDSSNSSSSWPTLGQMISSGQRLVTFVDSFPDDTSSSSDVSSPLPWLLQEFSYMFETPYDNTDENAFNCNIDRPKDLQPPADDRMYVVNHFLYGVVEVGALRIEIPQHEKAVTTNGKSLSDHADMCSGTFGRNPNFIEVDFYDQGDAPRTIARLNGLPFIDTIQRSNATTSSPSPTIWQAGIATPTDFLKDLRDRISAKIPHVLIDNQSAAPSGSAFLSDQLVYIQILTVSLLFIIH